MAGQTPWHQAGRSIQQSPGGNVWILKRAWNLKLWLSGLRNLIRYVRRDRRHNSPHFHSLRLLRSRRQLRRPASILPQFVPRRTPSDAADYPVKAGRSFSRCDVLVRCPVVSGSCLIGGGASNQAHSCFFSRKRRTFPSALRKTNTTLNSSCRPMQGRGSKETFFDQEDWNQSGRNYRIIRSAQSLRIAGMILPQNRRES